MIPAGSQSPYSIRTMRLLLSIPGFQVVPAQAGTYIPER